MTRQQCFSPLLYVLTLGLAASGYAQQTDTRHTATHPKVQNSRLNPWHPAANDFFNGASRPSPALAFNPALITPSQAFRTPIHESVNAIHLPSNGSQPADIMHPLIASYPLYSYGPLVFDGNKNDYFRDSYTLTATNKEVDSFWFYDEFDIPYGAAGTTGATMTSIITTLRNIAAVPTAHVQDVYGTITIYDTWNINAPTTNTVAGTALGKFDFHVLGSQLPVRSEQGDFFEFPVKTPITLRHDPSTPNELPYAYGMQFWDDAAHTIPCTSITSMHAEATTSTTPTQTVQVDVGLGFNRNWINLTDAPPPATDGYSDGTLTEPANYITRIMGTAVNPLTYTINGTLYFPTLPTTTYSGVSNSPVAVYQSVTFTVHPHAGGPNTTFTEQVGLGDYIDASGNLAAQSGEYTIAWYKPGTYDITINAYGFSPVVLSNVVVGSTNLYGVDATLDSPIGAFENVTGNIALEGVNDYSALNTDAGDGSLLGTQGGNGYYSELYDVSFRKPGSATPLFDYVGYIDNTTSGPLLPFAAFVPDGTYDVIAIGTINLAVLQSSVVISSTKLTVPDFMLPAGDANGDNVVDTSDFNILVGAFGIPYDPNDPADNTSGYSPFADFNFDGVADTSDFNLLAGEFGNAGSPF